MSVSIRDKTTGEWVQVAGGTMYADSPIGSIIPFGGTTAPDGFLLCQGQAVSRTTYAELFAVIGTSFGSGDGSTTFNVPDLRGKVPVGLNSSDTEFNSLGKTGGEKTHRHDFRFALYDYMYQPSGANAGMSGESDNAGAYRYSTGEYQGGIQVSTTSIIVSAPTGYSAETANKITTTGDTDLGSSLQPYNTVNYIIKATQVSVPADFAPVDAVENGNMRAVTSNAVYDALFANDVEKTFFIPTHSSGAVVAEDCWYIRKGNVVTVSIGIATMSASAPGEKVFTLPAGLRPCGKRIICIGCNNNYDSNCSIQINQNGDINVICDTGCFGTITYVTE